MKKTKIVMVKVESSNINMVGYDEGTRTLRIEFNQGSTYEYHPITKSAYEEFIAAESLGRYFNQHIKNNETVTTTKI